MKRGFSSPLLTPHDSSVSHANFSNLSKADLCLQPDVRIFRSPLVVKRDRESSVGNISQAKQISSLSPPDDQSMEVPKTPQSCPRAAYGTKTAKRRPLHGSDKSSQFSSLLSSTPLRRPSSQYCSTTKPSVCGANKRECRGVRKSKSDDLQLQVRSKSSKSVYLQSEMIDNPGDNLALGNKETPFRQSNDMVIASTSPTFVEFLQPGQNPLESELAPSPRKYDSQGCIGKAGNLSTVLQVSEFVHMTKRRAPGGSHDVSILPLTSPESPTKLAFGNICSLEVFVHPPALQDIGALSYNGESVLDNVRGMAENAKTANSPARSAKESEQMNDYVKKLKDLLVPTSVPLANLVSRNQSPKGFIEVAFDMVQPWSHSTRASIKENARSRKTAQPEILVNKEEISACLTTCLLKTTKLRQEVSGENKSHLRLSPQQQNRNLKWLQIACDGISYNTNHPASSTPHQSTKSHETTARTLSRNERLSPSPLYVAQSLEFRRIWSSKRLKMAELAVSCLTQNEFQFSTLI